MHSPRLCPLTWLRIFLGHLFDISYLQASLRDTLGDLYEQFAFQPHLFQTFTRKCMLISISPYCRTFQEAYDRTGRIINVSVSPSISSYNSFLLLNYLTAPNVLLWSAVSASCAIPIVFAPVGSYGKRRVGWVG